jgi:hypothetical protein
LGAELIEYLKYTKTDGENIFHDLIRRCDIEMLTFFTGKLKNLDAKAELTEILTRTSSINQTVLHYTAGQEELEILKNFWEFLDETVENREILKDLIIHQDNMGFDFIDAVLELNKINFFDFILRTTKQSFTSAQFHEILKSVASAINQVIHQVTTEKLELIQNIWKVIGNICDKSDIRLILSRTSPSGGNLLMEVLNTTEERVRLTMDQVKAAYGQTELTEYLQHVNDIGQNILIVICAAQDAGILKYLWIELKNHFKSNFFKFVTESMSSLNILHVAAHYNNIEFHECLWYLLCCTFEEDMLKKMIFQNDKTGSNFLLYIVASGTDEIIEFTLNKLKNLLYADEFTEILKFEKI